MWALQAWQLARVYFWVICSEEGEGHKRPQGHRTGPLPVTKVTALTRESCTVDQEPGPRATGGLVHASQVPFGMFYFRRAETSRRESQLGHKPCTKGAASARSCLVCVTTIMANTSHKTRDRTKENFAKSCKSGAARLNKLHQKYSARIYLQVQ